MIVRCERCETRFKLDESRIPARGARVRCSRCKHAFFVTPPGVAKEEAVHEVAAAAARAPAEAARPPEPSWDLEEGPGATIARRAATAAPSRAGGDEAADDTDWRFEDDVPGLDPGATRSAAFDLSGSQTAPSLAAPPDPNESSFAGLGDPETWDLLGGDAPAAEASDPTPPRTAPAPVAAPPVADAAETAPSLASAAAPAALDVVDETPPPAALEEAAPPPARHVPATARSAFAPPAVVTARHLPAAPRAPSALALAGWAGVAVLVAAIAWGALLPSAPVAPAATALAPVAGFEVREAHARLVDNAAAGPMLVVTGRLRNPGPVARAPGALEVRLLAADGAPLADGAAAAGPALPDPRLREDAPERLRAAQQAATGFATGEVAAGAELAFTAIFAPAPHAASAFALAPAGGAAR